MIVIVGPTASGKTTIGLKLAKKINGEIVSADSRQIYKYLDIGTDKPKGKWQVSNGSQYRNFDTARDGSEGTESLSMGDSEPAKAGERRRGEVKCNPCGRLPNKVRHISRQYTANGIVYHLVDFLDPDETFSAGNYVRLARKVLKHIKKLKHNPIVVGGTGLYINALIDGMTELPERNEDIRKKLNRLAEKYGNEYLHKMLSKIDPVTANGLHKCNLQRIIRALEVYEITGTPISKLYQTKGRVSASSEVKNTIFFGMSWPRDILYKRIEQRVDEMLNRGIIEETKKLLESGYSEKCPALQSLGYKHIIKYLNNNIQYDAMRQLIIRDTRHYAKRQLTWFRRDTRINQINCEKLSDEEIVDFIIEKSKEK